MSRIKPLVLVCGLPSSGNGFICTAIGQTDRDTLVHHGDDQLKYDERSLEATHEKRPFIAAILPVRGVKPWRLSVGRRWPGPARTSEGATMLSVVRAGGWEEYRRITRYRIFSFLADAVPSIPLLCISYEALVADPINVGEDLMRFIGARSQVPERWWMVNTQDGNEKYHSDPFPGVRELDIEDGYDVQAASLGQPRI